MRRAAYLISLLLLILPLTSGGGQTASGNDDEKLCPVHHVPLKHGKREILYGLVADVCDSLAHAKAEQKFFPYANSVAYGGCLVFPDSPKSEDVLYCPKCREVEKTWPCLVAGETPIVTELPPPRVTKLPTLH
jgi:hypothetical protein